MNIIFSWHALIKYGVRVRIVIVEYSTAVPVGRLSSNTGTVHINYEFLTGTLLKNGR